MSSVSSDDEKPEPLVGVDVDLRGLPYMPLDTVRLADSDLAALSTGDEFKAAVMLWIKAWQQVPAASLPDDDRILARLSGAGARWLKVKTMALRGFVRCTDGRLYHPIIAEKARKAWEQRAKQRAKAIKSWENRGTSGSAAADATAQAAAPAGATAAAHAPADAAAMPEKLNCKNNYPSDVTSRQGTREPVDSSTANSGRDVALKGERPKPPPGWERDPDIAKRFGESIGYPPYPGEELWPYVARLKQVMRQGVH